MTNLKLQQNSVNQIFNANAFFFLLTGDKDITMPIQKKIELRGVQVGRFFQCFFLRNTSFQAQDFFQVNIFGD